MGAFFFFRFFVILKLTAEQFPGNNGYHQNERLVLVSVYTHALYLWYISIFQFWLPHLFK